MTALNDTIRSRRGAVALGLWTSSGGRAMTYRR